MYGVSGTPLPPQFSQCRLRVTGSLKECQESSSGRTWWSLSPLEVQQEGWVTHLVGLVVPCGYRTGVQPINYRRSALKEKLS